MGKKSTPKMPEMPDVEEMIRTSARVNRVNQTGPYGQTRFEEHPDGTWSQYTGFSSELQPLFDRQINMAGAAPASFQGRGMGSKLRDRIDAKLGRGTAAQADIPDWGRVMPTENPDPSTEPTTGPVGPQTPPIRPPGGALGIPAKPQHNDLPLPSVGMGVSASGSGSPIASRTSLGQPGYGEIYKNPNRFPGSVDVNDSPLASLLPKEPDNTYVSDGTAQLEEMRKKDNEYNLRQQKIDMSLSSLLDGKQDMIDGSLSPMRKVWRQK